MEDRYKIIADPEAFREFIDWLPDCEPNEQFYCCLFSRKKYVSEEKRAEHPWIKSDKDQLKRFTSRKEFLYKKVEQCEAPHGAYEYAPGKPVFQEAMAIYVSVNPRDLWKAHWGSVKKLLTIIESEGKLANPHQEVMSIIQQTSGKKRSVMFDFDTKVGVSVQQMIDTCDGFCDIIETRGGYHVHVLLEYAQQIKNKKWHNAFRELPFCDVSGDEMSPMVGTYQGGFVPRFAYRFPRP